MVALVFSLALALAAASGRVARAMADSPRAVKRWGGRVLVLVGAWLVASAVLAETFADVFPV